MCWWAEPQVTDIITFPDWSEQLEKQPADWRVWSDGNSPGLVTMGGLFPPDDQTGSTKLRRTKKNQGDGVSHRPVIVHQCST